MAGVATAAGCQLVATCDLALASEEASFATPGVKIAASRVAAVTVYPNSALVTREVDVPEGQGTVELVVTPLPPETVAGSLYMVDVLVGPTTPTTAFELGAKTSDPVTMYLNDIYTIGANLAGLPAMSVARAAPSAGVRTGDRRAPIRSRPPRAT